MVDRGSRRIVASADSLNLVAVRGSQTIAGSRIVEGILQQEPVDPGLVVRGSLAD